MVKLFRFLAAVALLLWLGVAIGISFFTAPSLFGNESGQIANSSVAGDVMSPLLRKMDVTAWVAIPIAAIFLVAAWRFSGGAGGRALAASLLMLGIAICGSLFSGTVLTREIRQIRSELSQAYGGYHLAPEGDPERRRFGVLHGQSMMIAMGNLLLGFGVFFCATQLIGQPAGPAGEGDRASRPAPGPARAAGS
jgi:hypothetical protein